MQLGRLSPAPSRHRARRSGTPPQSSQGASSEDAQIVTGMVAALTAVAQHHGLDHAVGRVLHEHGLERDRLPERDVATLATALGLESRAVRLDWHQLAKLAPALPLVLRLRDGRCMILRDLRLQGDVPLVMIEDPVTAPGEILPVDRLRLEGAWTGEAILLRRRHAARSEDRPFGLVWLLARLLEDRATFRDLAVATLVASLFALAPPLVYMVVVDRVLVHQRPSTLMALTLLIGFVLFFDTAFGWLRRRLIAVASARLDGRLGVWMFDRLLALPLELFERNATGVIVHKLNEIRRVRNFLTGQLFGTVLDSGTLLVLVPVMFMLQPSLAWLVLGMAGLMGLVVTLFMAPLSRAYAGVVETEHRRNAFLVETVQGMRTIKALALEPTKRREWDRRVAAWVRATTDLQLLVNLPQTILAPLERGIYATTLLVGAWLVIQDKATLEAGTLVAFTMIATRVAQPFVQLAGLLHQIQEVRGALVQVASIVDLAPERGRSGVQPRIAGRLELAELTYRYKGSAVPALEGLDVTIEPGSMIGIMGRSGSGKTTLTRLLQGFHPDYGGLVRIDGVELREIDLAHLRRHLGIVLQDSFLFQGSIKDNILAGRPGLTPERMVEAARLAGAEEFIERLPRGYDTLLEEGGSNLSGGQRQRLAIARAIVSDPRILILDEATSSLDPDSEAIVNASLRMIARDRTLLIVSHRLTSLVDCDRILVLERGRLAACAPHDELLRSCEPYRRLWRQQQRPVDAASLTQALQDTGNAHDRRRPLVAG